jgi:hypothetical protein
MTIRATIIGMLAAFLLASLGYLNDSTQGLTYIIGNHLPISVFGLLIFGVIVIHPLLRKIGWHFRTAELALIVTLMLVAASIPGSGLMRCFPPTIVMPADYNRNSEGWKKANVMGYVPPRMLVGGGEYVEKAIVGFEKGFNPVDQKTAWSKQIHEIPWEYWKDPLIFWLPLIGLTAIAVVCVSLIVHRQWSSNERLRYPIASFANMLTDQDPRGGAVILRNKLFWGALIAVFALRVINGIHAWYPTSIEIPLKFSFDAVTQKWPTLPQVPGATWIINTELFPTVVAFAFFLASDVSFSLGILNFVCMAVGGAFLSMGIILDTGYTAACPYTWSVFGSYLGLALVILWVGRHYYKNVVRQGFTFVRQEGMDPSAPWAFRVLILTLASMVGMLIWVDLPWTIAILTVGTILLLFLVMGRINAETGLFFIQSRWFPITVLIGMLGVKAFGPKAMAIVSLVSAVLTMDPRECLMPFLLNGLKMSESAGIKPSRVGWTASSTYLLGLAGAMLVVLCTCYNHGGPTWDGWGFGVAPTFGLNEVQKGVENLTIKHQLDASENMSAVQRVLPTFLGGGSEPDSKFLWAIGVGFMLVVATSILRLRFTWWPLHPVLFLCWGTFPAMAFAQSLLLGWVIKTGVTKFGGGKKYQELKPMMVGIIAGDLLGGLLFMVIGISYHAATGRTTPIQYLIFPG